MFIRNRVVMSLMAAACFLSSSVSSDAQTVVKSRVLGPLDDRQTFTIHGTIVPLVKKSADEGRLNGDRKLGQMLLMLSPTKEQNAALEAVIKEMHTPSSPKYQSLIASCLWKTCSLSGFDG